MYALQCAHTTKVGSLAQSHDRKRQRPKWTRNEIKRTTNTHLFAYYYCCYYCNTLFFGSIFSLLTQISTCAECAICWCVRARHRAQALCVCVCVFVSIDHTWENFLPHNIFVYFPYEDTCAWSFVYHTDWHVYLRIIREKIKLCVGVCVCVRARIGFHQLCDNRKYTYWKKKQHISRITTTMRIDITKPFCFNEHSKSKRERERENTLVANIFGVPCFILYFGLMCVPFQSPILSSQFMELIFIASTFVSFGCGSLFDSGVPSFIEYLMYSFSLYLFNYPFLLLLFSHFIPFKKILMCLTINSTPNIKQHHAQWFRIHKNILRCEISNEFIDCAFNSRNSAIDLNNISFV